MCTKQSMALVRYSDLLVLNALAMQSLSKDFSLPESAEYVNGANDFANTLMSTLKFNGGDKEFSSTKSIIDYNIPQGRHRDLFKLFGMASQLYAAKNTKYDATSLNAETFVSLLNKVSAKFDDDDATKKALLEINNHLVTQKSVQAQNPKMVSGV